MLQSITPSFGFSVIHIQQSDMYAAVVNTIFWIFSNPYPTVRYVLYAAVVNTIFWIFSNPYLTVRYVHVVQYSRLGQIVTKIGNWEKNSFW